jgi:hypothetical protein
MKFYRVLSFFATVGIAVALAGCATGLTSTREIRSSYAIFDIQAGPEVGPARIAEAVRTSLQKQMSRVQITNSIPPSPLAGNA